MASHHRDQEVGGFFNREEATLAEDSPLLRPMSTTSAKQLCTCGVIAMLVMSWCVLDFWNRKVSDDLFNIGSLRMLDMTLSHELQVIAPFKKFSYPLTLAFLQFAFMGMAFLSMYFAVTQQRPSDLRGLNLTSDKRWPALVVSHVFSTFWLQSLMMPSQVMSLGFFAASRAAEIPAAALMRPAILGQRFGKKSSQTAAFAFAASCLLYYSYAQLAGCVCILSGNGVSLSGVAFWIVYLMILAMPAANAVCQEAIMVQSSVHPLLLLALQNIFSSLLFSPVLFISHLVGWEDIGAAFQTILSYQEVFMLVTWLCAQIALASVICIMLIHVVDSFWAIALRPIRVVFWGMIALINFYMSSGLALSVASPAQSFWSFMICCGCACAGAAIFTDRKAEDDIVSDKPSGPPAEFREKKASA
jgi:hypothetical protein